jgi:hypothetical protein
LLNTAAPVAAIFNAAEKHGKGEEQKAGEVHKEESGKLILYAADRE